MRVSSLFGAIRWAKGEFDNGAVQPLEGLRGAQRGGDEATYKTTMRNTGGVGWSGDDSDTISVHFSL